MIKRLLILFLLLPLGAAGSVMASTAPLAISVDHGVSLTLGTPAASVFIANPDIADVQVMSPTSIMIFGKRTGETTFMATDSAGHTLEQRTISVIQDLTSLRREFDMAIPGNRIRAESIPNGIVLTGEAKDASAVADAFKMAQRYIPGGGDIINRIRVAGSNQIQIRVRFAEVSRNIDNTLGIDWQSIASVGGFVFGLGTGNAVINATTGALFPRPNNTTLTTPNDAIGFSHAGKHFNINGMIDALAQDGLITVLAEPTLTAMSGETANFLAGGEFPIAVPQGGNSNLVTIQFKSFGVSLSFTPTLIGENRINLHVKPEVSQLSTEGAIILDNISVPSIKTRRAETTVEVASGQSFAIAGLIDNNQNQTVNKYPLLGDLPILGALFRSDHFINGQTELIVIITPYIVRPTGEQLALPTDGFSPPSESERLIGLRSTSSDPNARPVSGEPDAVRAAPPMDQVSGMSSAPLTPVAVENTGVMTAPAKATSNITLKSPAPAVPVQPAPVAVMPVEQPVPAGPMAPASMPVMPEPAGPAPAAAPPSIHIDPATAAPTNLSPGGSAPAGSGGFILE
jgi:pilus assembly protein CpaC